MRQLEAKWLKGYVTIKVVGYYPERFFDLCARNGIQVWKIKKTDQTICTGHVYLHDIQLIKKLRTQTRYKLYFTSRSGAPFTFKRMKKKKPMLLAAICSLLFVLYLSNIVWRVEITGVRPEVEMQLRTTLEEQGVSQGRLKFLIDPPNEIQKNLLEEHSDLLWVGVKVQGTTYHLEVVEKTNVNEREEGKPSHIVASKDGVIIDMYVSKGRPLVGVNEFVRKGQTLVSGHLADRHEDDESEQHQTTVESIAEVYATTWYESTLSVPIEAEYQTLTGEQSNKYFLGVSNFRLPIWGFFSKTYENTQIETNKTPIQFLKWELPIYFIKEDRYQVEEVKESRTQKEASEIGIDQARQELLQTLGREAEIIDQKILHESLENGKVNLHLYFTVKENIAKTKEIPQGD